MSKGNISKKQEEILEYIKSQILQRGFPPAVREICDAVNLKSTSSVHSHLETLEKNGYIRRDPTKPRAIEILDDSFNLTRREMVQIPIVGHVAAGEPVLAQENIEDYYPVPTEYISSNKELFMLKVQGESMINAGILDGDYVIVEKQATAENGDMVVALIDDGATVKTFYREEGVIRLQPENDAMEPFILEDVTILGKLLVEASQIEVLFASNHLFFIYVLLHIPFFLTIINIFSNASKKPDKMYRYSQPVILSGYCFH